LGAVILIAGWLLERRVSPPRAQSAESPASSQTSPLTSPSLEPKAAVKKCPYCAEEIQYEAIKCRFCGEMLQGTLATDAGPRQGSPVLRVIGALALIAGAAAAVYYFAFFDTSVPTETVTVLGRTIGGDRGHNIGLMQDRQSGLILGALAFVIGLGLLVYAEKRGRWRRDRVPVHTRAA